MMPLQPENTHTCDVTESIVRLSVVYCMYVGIMTESTTGASFFIGSIIFIAASYCLFKTLNSRFVGTALFNGCISIRQRYRCPFHCLDQSCKIKLGRIRRAYRQVAPLEKRSLVSLLFRIWVALQRQRATQPACDSLQDRHSRHHIRHDTPRIKVQGALLTT